MVVVVPVVIMARFRMLLPVPVVVLPMVVIMARFRMLLPVPVVIVPVVVVPVVVVIVLGVVFALVMVFFVEGNRFDPLCRHHAQAGEVGGVDQPVEPAFELEPVDDEHFCLTHGPGVGGGRLIDVGIAVGAYERRDSHVLAPDALHHVAKDREGRNDGDRFCRLGRYRSGQRQGKDGGCGLEEGSTGRHGISFQDSKWRRGKACVTRPPDGPSTTDTP